MQGTITFPGNPWPGGHAIKELRLAVRLHETTPDTPAHTSLDLYLKSEEYSFPQTWEEACAASDKQFEDNPDLSDWEDMGTWNNYHACHLNPASTHKDLVLSTNDQAFLISMLDGFSRHIDPVDQINEDDDDYFDARAYHCYILGHDAVAGHHINLKQDADTGLYHIKWTGRVASAYVGSYAFDRGFEVDAKGVPFAGYRSNLSWPDPKTAHLAERESRLRALADRLVPDAGSLNFEPGKYPGADSLKP